MINTNSLPYWLRQYGGLFFLHIKDVRKIRVRATPGTVRDPGTPAHAHIFLSLYAKMAARAPAITPMSQASGWKNESEKGKRLLPFKETS